MKHNSQHESYSHNLVISIFNKSIEFGLCARCGKVVVITKDQISGRLYGEKDGIMFYACKSCYDLKKGKFFKTNWFTSFISERDGSRRNNDFRKDV